MHIYDAVSYVELSFRQDCTISVELKHVLHVEHTLGICQIPLLEESVRQLPQTA